MKRHHFLNCFSASPFSIRRFFYLVLSQWTIWNRCDADNQKSIFTVANVTMFVFKMRRCWCEAKQTGNKANKSMTRIFGVNEFALPQPGPDTNQSNDPSKYELARFFYKVSQLVSMLVLSMLTIDGRRLNGQNRWLYFCFVISFQFSFYYCRRNPPFIETQDPMSHATP